MLAEFAAVLAPLLAIAVVGSRADPVPRAPRLFTPIPAAVAEMVVVWVRRAPVLHQLARQAAWLLALEQFSFLAVGLWVWLSAFGGHPADRAGRAAGGISCGYGSVESAAARHTPPS